MSEGLLSGLEKRREGYDKELALHRLYLDAYSGMGGFSGAVRQPTTDFWGSGASLYRYSDAGSVALDTYLDKFARESANKFRDRANAAHYTNYIRPLTDLKLSYIFRKDFAVQGRPDALNEWRGDVDGRGTTWEHLLRLIALRSATVGWTPCVVDMPPSPRDDDGNVVPISRAAANELGLRPTVIPLFPANLTNYQVDELGAFTWAIVRTDHVEQADPFQTATEVTRYTVWYADRFSIYEVVKSSASDSGVTVVEEDTPHDFGRVPIAVLPHAAMPDDPVKGYPMHGQESIEARAHFNRLSELEEHLRGQVFSILVLASEAGEDGGNVTVGVDNGLYLDPNATQSHYFLQPDGSVAETYEKRLETTVEEIYRQARAEFARPTQSRAAVSGIARKFEFAQTDRALSDFAKQIARFEQEIDALVAAGLGVTAETKVTPPRSFDVEDLQTDLELAVMGINDLQVGPTASKLIRERVVRSMLPNMTDEDAAQVEEELEELEKQLAQERAAMQELMSAESDDDETDDDESGAEGSGEGAPGNRPQQPAA